MKQRILLFLSATLLLSACKKNEPTPNLPLGGTILLSGISDNNNRLLADFSYSGKLLAKAVLTDGTFAETHTFTYNNLGYATATTITSANPAYAGDVSSLISYNSQGSLAEIKFYKANNVLDQDITFTYLANGLNWINSTYSGGSLYAVFDGAYYYFDNNISTQSASLGFYGDQINPGDFDTQNNICKAFPLYLYFATNVTQPHPCIPQIPGLNNPTNYSTYIGQGGHIPGSVIYTYNANNYPSSANMVALTYNFNTSLLYWVSAISAQYTTVISACNNIFDKLAAQ